MDSFHFAQRIPGLLIEGLSIESKQDFALLLIALVLTTFFLECLKRVSRELLRKVPKPSRTKPEGANYPRLVRQRSDQVPLTNSTDSSAEEAVPCIESEGNNNGYIGGEDRVGLHEECCSTEDRNGSTDVLDKETESLVEKPTCCQVTTVMTEEEKRARLERTWKSLSLNSLPGRWEMLQMTYKKERGAKRISHSHRVVFHLLQTVLGVGQNSVGYILMMIIMSYNAWLLIGVVVGAGLGYLVFSSDLERLYANYAESYVKRKVLEEETIKRKSCASKDGCCAVTPPTAGEQQSETTC